MKLIFAYIMVVFIWSTTPIAIQFSQSGLDYFTSLSVRIWCSAVLSLLVLLMLRQPLMLSRRALQSYLAGSLGIYAAMMSVYWGAAYLPSGLISVIYALAPLLSGAAAWWLLGERELTPVRIVALVVALIGLTVVVSSRLTVDEMAWKGVLGSVVSVFCFAMSAVWVKHANAGLHPMVQTSGTLLVSSIFYLLTLPFVGVPEVAEILLSFEALPIETLVSLSYLIVFGSLIAFMLYFYILTYLPTSRVTLITLIAPVLAIIWGYVLKDERLQQSTLYGAAILLAGLAMYQWHKVLAGVLKKWFIRRHKKVA
ncbi:MAG: DMT family transporter [Oleibacter sp.]|nr:DMT family transporter [Thalassolituus sp.]